MRGFDMRTIRGPATGRFQTPVYTVRPFHATFFGRPTFTDTKVAMTGDPSCALDNLLSVTRQVRVYPRPAPPALRD